MQRRNEDQGVIGELTQTLFGRLNDAARETLALLARIAVDNGDDLRFPPEDRVCQQPLRPRPAPQNATARPLIFSEKLSRRRLDSRI